MILYNFISANHAVDNIEKQQIKISRINNLNDPFELWSSNLSDKVEREALRNWKSTLSNKYGLICLSKNWRNPLLWSHYAERHMGLCLGFEIPRTLASKVRYVKTRDKLPIPLDELACKKLLHTKYEGWKYEQEWRVWTNLEEKSDEGLYFKKFDSNFNLAKIIIGPLCDKTIEELVILTERYENKIEIIKSRLAFQEFTIARDKRFDTNKNSNRN